MLSQYTVANNCSSLLEISSLLFYSLSKGQLGLSKSRQTTTELRFQHANHPFIFRWQLFICSSIWAIFFYILMKQKVSWNLWKPLLGLWLAMAPSKWQMTVKSSFLTPSIRLFLQALLECIYGYENNQYGQQAMNINQKMLFYRTSCSKWC